MTIIVDYLDDQFIVKQYGKCAEIFPLNQMAIDLAKAAAELGWETIVKPTHIEYRLR